ncbi:hypothetical protein KJ885_00450, partial [Patescibacteria group bacterium]|nr:hypothetical protein [Patescibacteria group bacterium]
MKWIIPQILTLRAGCDKIKSVYWKEEERMKGFRPSKQLTRVANRALSANIRDDGNVIWYSRLDVKPGQRPLPN